jgi:hypothetical protein
MTCLWVGPNLGGGCADIGHACLVHGSGQDDVAILGPADRIRVIQPERLGSRLLILDRPLCVGCTGLHAQPSSNQQVQATTVQLLPSGHSNGPSKPRHGSQMWSVLRALSSQIHQAFHQSDWPKLCGVHIWNTAPPAVLDMESKCYAQLRAKKVGLEKIAIWSKQLQQQQQQQGGPLRQRPALLKNFTYTLLL